MVKIVRFILTIYISIHFQFKFIPRVNYIMLCVILYFLLKKLNESWTLFVEFLWKIVINV